MSQGEKSKLFKRKIQPFILKDIDTKIVLLSGPRQAGKTTLTKSLAKNHEYLNFDASKDRKVIQEESWSREKESVIFDELHKMKNWKRWIKGIYDTEGLSPKIIVTGSAQLDITKKMGDSLAGRYFLYRLHPLTLRELKGTGNADHIFKRLLTQGGFPEPYFSTEKYFYDRWKKTHLDIILRQDLLDIESVKRIKDIEILIDLLRQRVGSLISYQSLAEDLQVDPTTVKRWLILLENLFVIFRVSPWSKNIARSISKAGKYYFYDTGQVQGEDSIKFENLVANELLAAISLEQDTKGRNLTLHYLRNKDGYEIDFAIVENGKLTQAVEAKWGEDQPSKSFSKLFSNKENIKAIQVVADLNREKDFPFGVQVVKASKWLSNLEL